MTTFWGIDVATRYKKNDALVLGPIINGKVIPAFEVIYKKEKRHIAENILNTMKAIADLHSVLNILVKTHGFEHYNDPTLTADHRIGNFE